MSHFVENFSPKATYGAIYAGVPTLVMYYLILISSKIFPNPKSVN